MGLHGFVETSEPGRCTGSGSWTVLAVRQPRAVASAGAKQPAQNWYGPGESDCLIKTEHCDVRNPGVDAM